LQGSAVLFQNLAVVQVVTNSRFLQNSGPIRRVYERYSVFPLLTKLNPSYTFKLCLFYIITINCLRA